MYDIFLVDKNKLKLFGGYIYWWVWYKEKSFELYKKNLYYYWNYYIYGKKLFNILLIIIDYIVIGLYYLYLKILLVLEINVDWDRVIDMINNLEGYIRFEMFDV